MDPLHEHPKGEGRLGSFVRGTLIGVVAVAAIGIWAVNFELVLAGKAAGGPGWLVRILLCEAVPIATLCTLYRGLGRNQTFEQIVAGIVGTIVWFCGGFLFSGQSEDPAEALRGSLPALDE